MSILFERGLVLAKIETTFGADPTPSPVVLSATAIDATADVEDTLEEITSSTHGFVDGDGPFHLTIVSGALPGGLAVLTNYWVHPTGTTTPADDFTIHLNYTDAVAGTNDIDLTDAVGVFDMTGRVSDALLVEEPDVQVEPSVIERNNVSSTLSNDPIRIARKTGTFTFNHEVRHNGTTDGKLPPAVGRLLRGCGYSETEIITGTGTILNGDLIPINDPTGVFTFSKTTGYVGTLPRVVVMQCTTGGGSATAAFTIFSPAVGAQAEVNNTGQVLTEAGAFNLAESAQITVAANGITTDFAVGDTYVFWLGPPGVLYAPISTSFESLTIYVYFDGLLHELNGCRGTFTIEGAGADIARFAFTFQGSFVAVIDATQPNATFEGTIPPGVELANLTAIGGADFDGTDPDEFNLCAQAFTIDAGNDVSFKECINDADAIVGATITGRNPSGSFNPEAELEDFHPFWAIFANASRVAWQVRVGSVQGNVLAIFAPYAQYQDVSYGNRNEVRIYDTELFFARGTDTGNDELQLYFS